MIEQLRATLQAAGIRKALVIDDAYDQVPLANDLSEDLDRWARFFEDLTEDDQTQLEGIFPGYQDARADRLRGHDGFVRTLWEARSTLRADLIRPLFQRYEQDKTDDTAYLRTLTSKLDSFGLQWETCGRDFVEKGKVADLIIIDLFLSSAQTEDALEESIKGLRQCIVERMPKPPLVILMSRSHRLRDKRADFRDRSGLFESAFRIIPKAELNNEGKLARILVRLGSHYADSTKLAGFLDAWQGGLSKACSRTAKLIRTLDISDYAQVQQLLLTEEGEPTGSYLVDVFDRVLQHEIERETTIIDSAKALNTLSASQYPPPYVSGSPDLQSLVFRSLFQNHERLRLPQAQEGLVAFGDILRRTPTVRQPEQQDHINDPLTNIGPTQVLIVLTPACDLQRRATERVLLLVGDLKELSPQNWSYKETPVRTPIIEMPDGQRFWIRWNLKHLEAIGLTVLDTLLRQPRGFRVIARLREAPTLELQQKLLSALGRVGLPAPMPATFPTRVDVYLPGTDRKPFRVAVPGLTQDCGVCFVGRTGEKDMRLIISEDDCESVCNALASVPVEQIHPDARGAVTEGLNAGDLLLAMERGVVLPTPQQTGYKPILVTIQKPTDKVPIERMVGFISRDVGSADHQLGIGEIKKAGIILQVTDWTPPQPKQAAEK